MTRARFDDAARAALTSCVADIEKDTDAEIVLAVRRRSGAYGHVDFLFGSILAFVGLMFLLYSPVAFAPHWVAIDVVLLFVLGWFISSRTSAIRRLFTSSRFRHEAVRHGAAAMFYEAGIANTEAEMGVLIYLSLLERRIEVIADRGILKAVPSMEWNKMLFEFHGAGAKPEPNELVNILKEFGCLLANHLPPTGKNPNELPDAPRFDF